MTNSPEKNKRPRRPPARYSQSNKQTSSSQQPKSHSQASSSKANDPCLKNCGPKLKAIFCDQCKSWVNKNCLKRSEEEYKQLQASDKPWFCPTCKDETERTSYRCRINSSSEYSDGNETESISKTNLLTPPKKSKNPKENSLDQHQPVLIPPLSNQTTNP